MAGVRSEANVDIITGLVTAAQNVEKCVQRAGTSHQRYRARTASIELCCSTMKKKKKSASLFSMSAAEQPTWPFLKIGRFGIRRSFRLRANQITNDIRKGLGVLTEQAEKLKCQYGFAYVRSVVDDEPITIPGASAVVRRWKSISGFLRKSFEPRVEEISNRRNGNKAVGIFPVIFLPGMLERAAGRSSKAQRNLPMKCWECRSRSEFPRALTPGWCVKPKIPFTRRVSVWYARTSSQRPYAIYIRNEWEKRRRQWFD